MGAAGFHSVPDIEKGRRDKGIILEVAGGRPEQGHGGHGGARGEAAVDLLLVGGDKVQQLEVLPWLAPLLWHTVLNS